MNDIVNNFAHKHRCSRFDQQRMIEALVLELSGANAPEDPKGIQWVDVLGANDGRVVIQYSNEEEAEKAVGKLKAWERLKDKGFRFGNWDLDADDEDVNVLLRSDSYKGDKVYDFAKDLDLLFGGEE